MDREDRRVRLSEWWGKIGEEARRGALVRAFNAGHGVLPRLESFLEPTRRSLDWLRTWEDRDWEKSGGGDEEVRYEVWQAALKWWPGKPDGWTLSNVERFGEWIVSTVHGEGPTEPWAFWLAYKCGRTASDVTWAAMYYVADCVFQVLGEGLETWTAVEIRRVIDRIRVRFVADIARHVAEVLDDLVTRSDLELPAKWVRERLTIPPAWLAIRDMREVHDFFQAVELASIARGE